MKKVIGLLSVLLCASAQGQVATEIDRLFPSDGAGEAGYQFGSSVALGDGYIAVGSTDDDEFGENAGAVYVFDSTTRQELGKLFPGDGQERIEFGRTLIIDDGLLLVGVPSDSTIVDDGGAVYIFDLATQVELMKITPSDLTPSSPESLSFGESISVDDGVLAVSAVGDNSFTGAVYLFDIATGDELMKIVPDDGETNDLFGRPVAISEGIVVVGTKADPSDISTMGSVYMYSAETGQELHRLTLEENTEGSFFGRTDVQIDDGMLFVGDIGCNEVTGCVYFFDLHSGEQLGSLTPENGTSNDDVGRTIVVENGKLIAGSSTDRPNGISSGSMYIFDVQSQSQLEKVVPVESEQFLAFGRSIAMDGSELVVGSQGVGSTDFDGSAFVFDLSFACSRADMNGDGALSYFDVSIFVIGFLSGDSGSDFNNDNVLDFFDVSEFLDLFNMGCP